MSKRDELEQSLENRVQESMNCTDLKSLVKTYLFSHELIPTQSASPLSIDKLTDLLETGGLYHTAGYFHYTTWSNFVKMILGSNGIQPYRLILGSCDDMNDQEDWHCGSNSYFASFSIGREENLAMWCQYGIPRKGNEGNSEDGIRIRFPFVDVIKWFACKLRERKSLAACEQDLTYQILSNLHFSDVGYYCENEKCDWHPPYVYYQRKDILVSSQELTDCLYTGCPKRILFKRIGWKYEREVRLSTQCFPVNNQKVTVDFTNPLKAVLKNPAANFLLGPWFDRKMARKCVDRLWEASGKDSESLKDVETLRTIIECRGKTSAYTGCVKSPCEKCSLKKN